MARAIVTHQDAEQSIRRHRWQIRTAVLMLPLLLSMPPGVLAETLLDALAAAHDSNPALLAERARMQATYEEVPQALAPGLPNLEASVETSRIGTTSMPGSFYTSRNPSEFNVTARLPLFRGFRTLNSVHGARARVRSGEFRLVGLTQSLCTDVAEVYANVHRDRHVVGLQQSNLSFLDSELAATRAREKAGDKSRTDIAQALARREAARAELSFARADLFESEASYAAIVGTPPGKLSAPVIANVPLPASLEEAFAIADDRNPGISASREDAIAADYQTKVGWGALLPTVSLEASYDDQYNLSSISDRTEETTILARVTLPLYEGGARWSRIKEASAQAIARSYDHAQARVSVKATVTALYRHRIAAKDRISAENAQVDAARTALRGVQLEAKVGHRSVADILDAQRDLVDAEVSLANAQRDYSVSTFRLLAELGWCDPIHLSNTVGPSPRSPVQPVQSLVPPATTWRSAIFE